MYKRYYDGYGRVRREADPGEIIVPHSSEGTYSQEGGTNPAQSPDLPSSQEISVSGSSRENSLFGLELDDLLLVGVLIFLLINNDNDDPLMPIIIGFVLISELL